MTPIFAISLGTPDLLIIGGYLAVMLAIGVWVGRGQASTKDYFLGDRSLPWWAVLLSIVATETSTVTFLSIPGMAFAAEGDLRFLQITFGYIVGRILVVWVLLPLYFRGEPFTAYEVLQRRFGKTSRRATSLLFLVTRNLSDALRLYLSALVLHTAVDLSVATSIIVMGVVTMVYTYIGGVKSVIWNDCVQFVIYIAGACVALYEIITGLSGGFDGFLTFAEQHDKLRVFDWDFSFTKNTMTFWAGLIGGAFLTGSTHGTDQLTVQRLLTARSQAGAAAAMIASGLVVCLQFALFLLIGTGLAAFFAAHPEQASEIQGNDRAFAYFIVHYLRTGLVGLTLAAVFSAAMSTLSGSLNSSATALVSDFIVPLSGERMTEAAKLKISRLATGVFGLVQIGIAWATYWRRADQSVVERVLAIAAFTSGPMLGLYLLAVLTPRVRETAALAGFVGGLGALTYIAFGTAVWWPWYAVFGSLATLAIGWLLSWTPLNGQAAEANGN